jgi:hypothetical protein
VNRPRILRTSALILATTFACTTVKMPEPRDSARAEPEESALPALAPSEAPESTLVRFSDALAAGDSATITGMADADFALLEDGRKYDLASTIGSIREALRGRTMQRATRDFDVAQRGDVAWATYNVRGLLRGGRNPVTFNRIESAVLVRDSTRWRVTLMTSIADSAKD